MYEEQLNLLKRKGIEFESGLTFEEIEKIEKIYQIQFPKSLKQFLMMALPVSNGFYNWRNIGQDNIMYIKQMIKRPIEDISNLAEEVYWSDEWGIKPHQKVDVIKGVREQLENAPELLPVYTHRYMPMLVGDNPPVLSIHGIDVIYYGEDLEDYLNVEFGEKGQSQIEFRNIKEIPFWSDIM